MSSIPTVEEFLEVCSEGGLEITWTDARDYLEEVTKRAEWLRVTAIPGDPPDWFRIASATGVVHALKGKGSVPHDMAARLAVLLVLTRQALDRAETRCTSLEHVLHTQAE